MILLMTADDKITRGVFHRHPDLLPPRGVTHVKDSSPTLGRVARLLLRGRMRWGTVFRMWRADLRRPRAPRLAFAAEIGGNDALLERLRAGDVRAMLLFRAGLIVSGEALKTGIPILNVHCARLPDYGGLGSIDRALREGAYEQAATLHRITKRIDEGEILDTEAYRLDPSRSYRENEDHAYEAGARLLGRSLKRLSS
jgi:hypothetical protein